MHTEREPEICRCGLCLMTMIAIAATACERNGGDDNRIATTQAPSPPPAAAPPPAAPPPPPPPDDPPESEVPCWETVAEIDGVGCLRVSFDLTAGDPEIYEASLVFPDELAFNGFSAAGPAGTVVGTMDLDLALDDVVEHTVLFVALNDGSAYADVLADDTFSPDYEPVFGHTGDREFLLRLPYGGDVDPETFFVPLAARITLSLRADLMTASASDSGSSFAVTGVLTSVDPETDNHDDGLGAAPTVTPFTSDVSFVE